MTNVNDPSKLNIGLCGFGASASYFHLPLIRSLSGLRLAAVFDPVLQRRLLAEEYGFESSFPPEQLESAVRNFPLHIVVICSPNSLHYAQTRTALLAGAHVLVDKPLALNSQELRDLIEIAENKNLVLMAFQNRRYDDDYLQALTEVKTATLGRVERIDFGITSWGLFNSYAVPQFRPNWRAEKRYGGGVLNDWGPHVLDQLLTFAEWKLPSNVCAIGRPSAWSTECEDVLAATYEWEDFFARVLISTMDLTDLERLRICGTKGTLVVSGTDESGQISIHGEKGVDARNYTNRPGAAAPIYRELTDAVVTGSRSQVSLRLRQTEKLFQLMDVTRQQISSK